MHTASLKCFGVGDGWPTSERGHSAFLYRFDDAAFLIDCGEPISRSYKASGLPYDLVDHLFLSHLHFDHAGGFFMLMQSFWLEQRKKDLPIHVPGDAIAPLRAILQSACIFDELLPFRLSYHALRAGEPIRIQSVSVTPFPTSHLAGMQSTFGATYPLAFEAYCFLLESGSVRIGHSADIGAVADLQPLLEKPLALLVCELAHVPPEELFEFLRGRPIRQLVFIHLSRECRDRLDELKAKAHEVLHPIRITFAEDGAEVRF